MDALYLAAGDAGFAVVEFCGLMFCYWIAFWALAGWALAQALDQGLWNGALLGGFLGPLGLLIVWTMPDQRPRCPACRMVVPVGATVCGHCREPFAIPVPAPRPTWTREIPGTPIVLSGFAPPARPAAPRPDAHAGLR